jgi:SAM-dependent methyltransferase
VSTPDFIEYWEAQTNSAHRSNKREFYQEKALEHLSYLNSEDRQADCLDLGCGAGELLEYILPRCKVVEAIDFSETMLNEARSRLVHHSGLELSCTGALEHAATTKCEVWMATGSVNQYLAVQDLERLLKMFCDSPTARKFCLFDTVDPDRYRLWTQGRIRYAPFDVSRKLILLGILEEVKALLTGGFRSPVVSLGGNMGFGFRPHFWYDYAARQNVSVSLFSSRSYEYRYHVFLEKSTD